MDNAGSAQLPALLIYFDSAGHEARSFKLHVHEMRFVFMPNITHDHHKIPPPTSPVVSDSVFSIAINDFPTLSLTSEPLCNFPPAFVGRSFFPETSLPHLLPNGHSPETLEPPSWRLHGALLSGLHD